MILSRTPLRISLVGGGTDMPAFYNQQDGCVISLGINKYVYVAVNKKFDGRTRLSYSITEDVERSEDLKHDIARKTLEYLDQEGVEIASMADIPGAGTGLGSSSSFTVGLFSALSAYQRGYALSPSTLARTAFHVESTLCGHPVGKQDQYAAAYGGLHCYTFKRDGVIVEPVCLEPDEISYLESHLVLYYTGITRSANDILSRQAENIANHKSILSFAVQMRDLALELKSYISRHEFSKIGQFLDEGWELKKRFANGINPEQIDTYYKNALNAGAIGGKLCGAGGGGFLLFWINPAKQKKVSDVLGLQRMDFKIDLFGSKIVFGEKS